MTRITPDQAGGANRCAFLDAVAASELGRDLLAESDDGYNVLVGATAHDVRLFDDYSQHPKIHNAALNSDAAGRYQFMGRYWEPYRAQLRLPDFGPISQDIWGLQLIRECHALDAIDHGHIEGAIVLCKSRWASLPGAGYHQHENSIEMVVAAYKAAGGVIV